MVKIPAYAGMTIRGASTVGPKGPTVLANDGRHPCAGRDLTNIGYNAQITYSSNSPFTIES
jgi:hypothetical protein